MNPNISLPQLPSNLDPALRDYLFAWQKLITSKQLDDYSANKSVDTRLTKIESSYKNYSNITVKLNTSNPNYQVDIEWDKLWIEGVESTSGDFTVDITSSGLLGLDTGSEAVSTWYYLWAIAKADGTVSVILSASSTAPTMPSGYTLKRLVSVVRNNSSGNFTNFAQQNEQWRYTTKQTAHSGGFPISGKNVDLSVYVPLLVNKLRGHSQAYARNSSGTPETFTVSIKGYVNGVACDENWLYGEAGADGSWAADSITLSLSTYNRQLYVIGTLTGGTIENLVIISLTGFEVPL